MNLREKRAPLEPFEMLVRESLRERADGRGPAPEVRDELMKRAARQEQRLSRPSSLASLGGLFGEQQSHFGYSSSHNHFICLDGLFGPRTSWFSFNQLSR